MNSIFTLGKLKAAPNLRFLELGAVVKAPSSFKLSSSISEAQRDTLT